MDYIGYILYAVQDCAGKGNCISDIKKITVKGKIMKKTFWDVFTKKDMEANLNL